VTCDAGTWLVGSQQRFRKRAMRLVADAAILADRDMFEDPWADKVLVAAGASLSGRTEPDDLAPMRIVAVCTPEHALEDGVMRWELQTRGNGHMTAYAEARRIVRIPHGYTSDRWHANVFQLPVVGIMTVRTRDTAASVVCSCPCQMGTSAVVTIQAIGIGREADIAGLLAVFVDASRTMTALAIRVVVGGWRMPTHLLVTDRALVGTNRLCPVDQPRSVIRAGRDRRPGRDTRHQPDSEAEGHA